jgi:TolB-like protein/DNA-binding winged helix-turn-helix (wHTH) protein/Tfp pilus assembly protein PilF
MVTPTGIEGEILRFGTFELDVRNNELRRAGVLIKLSPQQFRVLRFLAENAGRVCTREEIQDEIWGSEVFVDFDRGLNVCIAQIRSALNDDSEAPRFIQTVPRQGYRFVAPVEAGTHAPVQAPVPAAIIPVRRSRLVPVLVGIVLLLLACAGIAVWVWRPRPAVDHRTMLAVLPFENVTQVADDAPVIDGLADELITQFGTVQPERLGVIGRTSVLRYSGRNPGLAQIGRELAVEYAIEGGVRRESGRVRISVRLVKVADQSQVWNETFEQDGSNRLEMQEEVAARVTAAVLKQLFPQARGRAARAHVPDARAYDAYVKGRYLVHQHNRADMERAIAQFDEAGRLDPAFAEPWADEAQAYIGLTMSGSYTADDGFLKARVCAERALKLDDENAEAHNALASVLFWRDWNWNEAQRHFQRAIAINPSYAQAHHDYAFYQVATGHAEAGVASLRRAIALDPLSPRVNVDAGWVLLQAHHFDQAIAQAKRALELEPGMGEAKACIARAEQYQGKASAQAIEFYRAKVEQPEKSRPYDLALAYAVLGRGEDAIRALQAAYEQHSMSMPLMRTEPSFTSLHGDARFREIVRKLGLPE